MNARTKILVTVAGLGAAVALVATSVGAQPPGPGTDPRTAPIPSPADDPGGRSLVVVSEWADRDTASEIASYVVDWPARGREGEPPLMQVELLGPDGAVMEQFNAWHPQWEFVANADGSESLRLATDVEANLPVPYDPLLTEVTFTDVVTGDQVLAVDTLPALEDFCEDNLSDPDCEANVGVVKTGPTEPVAAGTQVTFTIEVTATGPNPARAVIALDNLPDRFSFVSSTGDCQATARTVRCGLGTMFPGETVALDLTAAIAADLVHLVGGPLTVTNTAAATVRAGEDPNPADDQSDFDVQVVAIVDLAVTDLVLVAPDLLVVGEPASADVDFTASNGGPSSPVDAVAGVQLGLVGGTANPAEQDVALEALAVGDDRSAGAAAEITCLDAGTSAVEATVGIEPASAADSDPDPTNNAISATLPVECILPVAINIRPGQSKNSVNAGAGVVSVGILTTDAGEYDLPLAFDAAWVDEDSLVFGSPDSALIGDGSPVARRSQSRDVRERSDERTRDGDADLQAWFRASQSGLTPADTEACVVGEFTRPDGTTGRFVGCDNVTVRP